MTLLTNPRIGIIGLGYVGLPLAVEFAVEFGKRVPNFHRRAGPPHSRTIAEAHRRYCRFGRGMTR